MEDINVGHQVVKLSLLVLRLLIFRRFEQTDVWDFCFSIIGSLGADNKQSDFHTTYFTLVA